MGIPCHHVIRILLLLAPWRYLRSLTLVNNYKLGLGLLEAAIRELIHSSDSSEQG